ncbi:hypothetical protein EC991_006356 [Linnemannia zychae]|nr:hypothetical protein EC991_006356 [Linnemannia zychae]
MFSAQPRPEDVVRLPEIVALLGPYLNPPDIFSCIQVCHLWNHLLTPWLWHTIDDSLYSWPTILAKHRDPESQGDKDVEWIRGIFAKYGHHIREFTSQWGVIMEVANTSGTCNQLESLRTGDFSTTKTRDDLYNNNDSDSGANPAFGGGSGGGSGEMTVYRYEGRTEPHSEAETGPILSPIFEGGVLAPNRSGFRSVARQRQDWATAQHFWLLVRQNRRSLFSLRLDITLWWLCDTAEGFIMDTLASLENLVNLENDMVHLDPNVLLERLPGLLSYRTWSKYFQNDSMLTRPFNQLIYLELWGGTTTRTFFNLLKYLPNLETLRMNEFRGMVDISTQDHLILENIPSNLKTLRFRNPSARVDGQIANLIIPWLPNLTEISLTQLHPASTRALVTHCRKLQVVKQIDDGNTIHPNLASSKPLVNMIGILLQECPTLKVIDAVHHTIDAEHMLKNPWACRELETFRCQIVGIPRLTAAEQNFLDSITTPSANDSNADNKISDNINDSNSMDRSELIGKQQRSQELQRQVMDHFAGLTNLTTLDLGYEYRDIWGAVFQQQQNPEWPLEFAGEPKFDSLQLTLATGLDRLSSLTRLETFGFEGTNHRIGKPELAWMATNWPKLKVLRGLHEDDLPNVEEDLERTKLREFMRELRVDVRHATLRPKVKFQ